MIDPGSPEAERVVQSATRVIDHIEDVDEAADLLHRLHSERLATGLAELRGHVDDLLDEIQGFFGQALSLRLNQLSQRTAGLSPLQAAPALVFPPVASFSALRTGNSDLLPASIHARATSRIASPVAPRLPLNRASHSLLQRHCRLLPMLLSHVSRCSNPYCEPTLLGSQSIPQNKAFLGWFTWSGPGRWAATVALWELLHDAGCRLPVMGGAGLDFREVRMPPGVTEVRVVAVMGGVEILVPPGLAVESHDFGVMGGFDGVDQAGVETDPDAPRLVIKGFACMGAVEVAVRLPGESGRDARRRRRELRRRQRHKQLGKGSGE